MDHSPDRLIAMAEVIRILYTHPESGALWRFSPNYVWKVLPELEEMGLARHDGIRYYITK